VLLANSQIEGLLSVSQVSSSNAVGTALDLHATTIGQCLVWRRDVCARGMVDLSGVRADSLEDDPEWYVNVDQGKLKLHGLTYRILAGPVPSQSRAAWLRSRLLLLERLGPEHFSRQPYDQLAEALDAEGRDDDAKAVRIELEEIERRYDCPEGRWDTVVFYSIGALGHLAKRFVGFGHDLSRLLYVALGLLVIATVWFVIANKAGHMIPCGDHGSGVRNTQGMQVFSAFLFAVDALVPFVELRYEEIWLPNLHSHAARWTRRFYWLVKIMGWVLLTFGLYGLTVGLE